MKPKMGWLIYLAAIITWALLAYYTLFEYLATGTLFARSIDTPTQVVDARTGKVTTEMRKRPYISDFVNTYNAAKLARRCLSGEKVNIYDPQVQDASARPLVAPVVPEQPFYLQYPPQFFAFVTPLAFVSLPVAWMVWNGICLAFVIFTFWLMTAGLDRTVRILACALAVSAYPCWLSVQLGQTSLLLFPCVAGLFLLLKRRRPVLAGLLCSLITIKIQYLPVFGLIGLLVGRLPFLGGCIAGGAALLTATLGVLGVENVVSWPKYFISGEASQGVSGVNVVAMQNFRAFLSLVLHGDSNVSRWGAVVLLVVALAVVARLWWRKSADQLAEPQSDFLVSLSILLALISSLHAHVQDYVLAAIPCLLIYRSLALSQQRQSLPRQRLYKTVTSYAAVSWLLFFLQPISAFLFIPPFFAWALWTGALIWFVQLRGNSALACEVREPA